MILGIMSDSHGDEAAVSLAVDVTGEVDLWLHAGDFCTDAIFLAEYSGKKVVSVAGNCDGLAAPSKIDEFIEIEGKRIWLTHGHQMRVKIGKENLLSMAESYSADIVVYGHTHITDLSQHGKISVFNPGSVARPYGAKPSLIKLMLENGKMSSELIELK